MTRASLITLKSELTKATLSYSDYLASIVNRKDITPLYSLGQVIAIRELIDKHGGIKPLYKAISDYCQHNLVSTFGEKWRFFFGAQKNYDLYANVQAVLKQDKYRPDALTQIEEDIEWRQQIREELRQEIRQDVLAQPEVIINQEIVRLNALTTQLQTQIENLQQTLNRMKQERDYWHEQYNTIKAQKQAVESDKSYYKSAYEVSQKQVNELKERHSKNHSQHYEQENRPNLAQAKVFS